jgi:hypothetical protein
LWSYNGKPTRSWKHNFTSTIELWAEKDIRLIKEFLPEQKFSWEHMFTLQGFLVLLWRLVDWLGTRYEEVVLPVMELRAVFCSGILIAVCSF